MAQQVWDLKWTQNELQTLSKDYTNYTLHIALEKADINNDMQVGLKGSKVFQDELERKGIIDELKCVNYSIISIDEDRSVKRSIEFIHKFIRADKYLFTNGGDQFGDTILEKDICNELGIELIDGLGEKIQSSSILKSI
jgi:D-beta-D-heptose 7-phosphate kinase/D-beta-D-heptose 1-phosphate adenosyltransferase